MKDLDIAVNNVKTYFYSEVSLESVSKQINALKKPLQKTMNKQLRTGVKLPVPQTFSLDITETDVVPLDNFILIESNPKINKPAPV